MATRMVTVTLALALALASSAAARQGGKILMIVSEDESADLELMLTKEVGVMRTLLEQAGFEVVVATATKRPLTAGSARLQPDLKLADVVANDYKALIMPCMATMEGTLSREADTLIRQMAAARKPIAAQTGSVALLADAGVLSGKKYALADRFPDLPDGVRSGDGIVRDGGIITSGICPYMATKSERPDGTSKLTEALIAELR